MLRKSSIAEVKKLKNKVTIAKTITDLKQGPEVSLLSQRREAETSSNKVKEKDDRGMIMSQLWQWSLSKKLFLYVFLASFL